MVCANKFLVGVNVEMSFHITTGGKIIRFLRGKMCEINVLESATDFRNNSA